MNILKFTAIFIFVFTAAVPLYALPATLTLQPGQRPGTKKLTLNEAAKQLRASGVNGWELVEQARSLVSMRMVYSRRNSFDTPGKAFERGYGYCMQHAYALSYLLKELGFETEVVQAFKNEFSDGKVTSHAWVSVKYGGEVRHIDSLFYDEAESRLDFTPLSEITTIPAAFKIFTFWGAPAVNAYRYYLTGKDI